MLWRSCALFCTILTIPSLHNNYASTGLFWNLEPFFFACFCRCLQGPVQRSQNHVLALIHGAATNPQSLSNVFFRPLLPKKLFDEQSARFRKRCDGVKQPFI